MTNNHFHFVSLYLLKGFELPHNLNHSLQIGNSLSEETIAIEFLAQNDGQFLPMAMAETIEQQTGIKKITSFSNSLRAARLSYRKGL